MRIEDRVGIGWFHSSCMACHQCLAGHHNVCSDADPLIVSGRGASRNGCARTEFGRRLSPKRSTPRARGRCYAAELPSSDRSNSSEHSRLTGSVRRHRRSRAPHAALAQRMGLRGHSVYIERSQRRRSASTRRPSRCQEYRRRSTRERDRTLQFHSGYDQRDATLGRLPRSPRAQRPLAFCRSRSQADSCPRVHTDQRPKINQRVAPRRPSRHCPNA